jgi:hypothetical protein
MTTILADHGLLLDAANRADAEEETRRWLADRGLDDETIHELAIPTRIRRAWRWSRETGGFVGPEWPGAFEVWVAHVPEQLLTYG